MIGLELVFSLLNVRRWDMFFNDYQINLAHSLKKSELRKRYRQSEKELKQVAKTGNDIVLAKVMKKHGNYEYAMLYQQTPEFRGHKVRCVNDKI